MNSQAFLAESIDQTLLASMPQFVALNYKRMLDANTFQEQVHWGLHTYNLGLRALTIGLVTQYLIRDADDVSDPYLNELLLKKFPKLTLDAWQQLLFSTLRAYEGKRDLFFIPELYDLYWDTTEIPHLPKGDSERTFARLTQISLEVGTKRVLPKTDVEWGMLSREVRELLREVLSGVFFISAYDLIRVLDVDNQTYGYELHKGLKILIEREPRPKNEELRQGWFYLRWGSDEFLPLYPFIVFWEETSGISPLDTDTGIYDRFIYENLQYLLASLGTTFMAGESVQRFISVLYETIENAKRHQEVTEKLNWWQLRDFCTDITDKRMATVATKYRLELYLQRDTIWEAFQSFLASDTKCFVLIGKSGVGKSNFFLSLRETLASRRDTCVLMYDGANLKADPSITAMISRDFDERLVLAGNRIADIWREIAKIEGIQEKQIVFFVDAINENPDARTLLRQLDDLVQSPWSWLKVVFSSRPETWQSIKRGVRLADGLYFREDRTKEIGIELEGFSYSERMEPFTGEELHAVYKKYQETYCLQTEYGSITAEIRDILRDPLSLNLVANTYANRPIPSRLKRIQLIGKYVDALMASGRLQKEDLYLLEQSLVPLMVKENRFTNALTLDDINAAGSDIFNAIYSEQELSNNQRVNQSFQNLLDTEILVKLAEGRQEQLAFKYERFYEFFIGKRLYTYLPPIDDSIQDCVNKYEIWLSNVSQAPFLWGAIKSCLLKQLQSLADKSRQTLSLVISLSQLENQRMTEILIACLIELGRDDRKQIEQILEQMLKQPNQFIPMKPNRLSTQCPNWKRIAIVVASNLALSAYLELALTDTSASVRAVALRHAYIYWRRNRQDGFALLDRLVERATGFFGVPIPSVFEPLIGLSLLILFDDFQNPDTACILRDSWRPTIEKLLWVNPNHLGKRRERVKSRFRSLLMQIVVNFVLRSANEVPSQSQLNIPEFKLFFKKDSNLKRRREIAKLMISHLAHDKGSILDIRRELLEITSEKDFLVVLLSVAALQKELVKNSEQLLPVVKELFERVIDKKPLPTFIMVPLGIILNEAGIGTKSSRLLLAEMTTRFLDQARGIWEGNLGSYRNSLIDSLTFNEIEDVVDAPLGVTARAYIDRAIKEQDYQWIRDMIQQEATTRGVEHEFITFAFSMIESVIHLQVPAIQDAIVEALARIRIYFPDQVDDFMIQNNLNEQMTADIRNRATSETLGDLLNLRALLFWQHIAVLGRSPEVWEKFLRVLQYLPDCDSLEQFIVILMKFAVNTVYGDSIFEDVPT